jgi:hypothetical protein
MDRKIAPALDEGGRFMTGRHWFRKDVLMPVFYLFVFGAALYWLRRELLKVPALQESDFVSLALRLILVIYLLLLVLTVSHLFTTYDLERYDPGDPASLKRLLRRHRYRLTKRPLEGESMLLNIERTLFADHYRLEAESHQIGRIYLRRRAIPWLGIASSDRVIILQHEPLNILLVDTLLQDCIHFLRSQTDSPSRRNILILVTRMDDKIEVASAAAGVVNFLGKFQGGTLCPLLLAVSLHRLFYPADRTLQPRSHRLFQDRLRWRLLAIVRDTARGKRLLRPARVEAGVRSPEQPER